MRTIIYSVIGILFCASVQARADCPAPPDCTITPVVFELITQNSTPEIRGTAEPSTQLKVIIAGAIYDTVVDENANWSVDLQHDPVAGGFYRPNHNGFNDVFLLSLTSDGRRLTDSSSDEILIDLAPPKTPRITRFTSKDTTPVLTGFADAYGVSSLLIAGATYSLQTNPQGEWSLDLSLASPVNGQYLPATDQPIDIVVRTIDQAGNTSIDLSKDELIFQLDSDFDGIANVIEGWKETASGNPPDTDLDGLPDYLDTDSDNDGMSDTAEAGRIPTLSGLDADLDNIDDAIDSSIIRSLDVNGDGLDDQSLPLDSDNDGQPDYLDTDSDNDGISDRVEGDGNTDADSYADYLDVDSDNDGILDYIEGTADTDHDGKPNFRDTDSDGDNIPDRLESGDQDNDLLPDRIDLDSDNDGISDLIETATDSDGDGVANFLDLDSDNDGVPDLYESAQSMSLSLSLDKNRDGILDHPSDTPESLSPGLDTDGDGLADAIDLDSDNDGIPDVIEGGGRDIDLNAMTDQFTDFNQNGISDAIEQSLLIPGDADQDQLADYRDLDSDNDGMTDLVETYGGQLAQSGLSHVFVDNNDDGLDDLMAISHAKSARTANFQTEDERLIASPLVTEKEVNFNQAPLFNSLASAGCSLARSEKPQRLDPILLLMVFIAVLALARSNRMTRASSK